MNVGRYYAEYELNTIVTFYVNEMSMCVNINKHSYDSVVANKTLNFLEYSSSEYSEIYFNAICQHLKSDEVDIDLLRYDKFKWYEGQGCIFKPIVYKPNNLIVVPYL